MGLTKNDICQDKKRFKSDPENTPNTDLKSMNFDCHSTSKGIWKRARKIMGFTKNDICQDKKRFKSDPESALNTDLKSMNLDCQSKPKNIWKRARKIMWFTKNDICNDKKRFKSDLESAPNTDLNSSKSCEKTNATSEKTTSEGTTTSKSTTSEKSTTENTYDKPVPTESTQLKLPGKLPKRSENGCNTHSSAPYVGQAVCELNGEDVVVMKRDSEILQAIACNGVPLEAFKFDSSDCGEDALSLLEVIESAMVYAPDCYTQMLNEMFALKLSD